MAGRIVGTGAAVRPIYGCICGTACKRFWSQQKELAKQAGRDGLVGDFIAVLFYLTVGRKANR